MQVVSDMKLIRYIDRACGTHSSPLPAYWHSNGLSRRQLLRVQVQDDRLVFVQALPVLGQVGALEGMHQPRSTALRHESRVLREHIHLLARRRPRPRKSSSKSHRRQ